MNITLRLLNAGQARAILAFLKSAIDFQQHNDATIQLPLDPDIYDFTEADLDAAIAELKREVDKFAIPA